MADRIRFTQLEDEGDGRAYDFDTERIQIGTDPDRGDNLLIRLPKGLRHVRALIFRTPDYVEMEVRGGPIWLQGSKMEEGDVAELNLGDIIVFGSKGPRGARFRFETAKEAEIVMDDVADWSASAAPKPKRGKSAEDDMTFVEEKDKYAGKNVYQKYLIWYREQYAKFAGFRKRAARIKYWVGLVKGVWMKAGRLVMGATALIAVGGGYWLQIQAKLEAVEEKELAVERESQSVLAEKQAIGARHEIEEAMRQCGCDSSEGSDAGAVAAADSILGRFGDDETLQPERAWNAPDKRQYSLASIISGPLSSARRSRTSLSNTLDRVCSPTKDKDRMELVQQELSKYGIHEAYAFIPFVESLWCEMAVSFTGPRGMMQFTRATAQEAFRKIDVTQADIPNYDWNQHNSWLIGKSKKYGGYYGMLAKCPATVVADYKATFYNSETNPQYPNRLDPDDPRTDWEWSTKAAFGWLEELDRFYRGKGFRPTDAIMLAMTAYNQGRGEVGKWISLAKVLYNVENEAALTFPQVYAGGIQRSLEVTDSEKRRQVKEGMAYAPKIMGYYLHAADQLDSRNCR